MKIIFLNVWNNELPEKIKEFVSENLSDTDIFCFQEVESRAEQMFAYHLPNYKKFICHKFVSKDDDFFLATYVRNSLKILRSEIFLEDKKNLGLGIYTYVENSGHKLKICNFHGLSQPGNKLDTPERIEQSRLIIEFFNNQNGPKIIGGDFNLFKDTRSVEMFAENGYQNLIKEFSIPTTRNRYVWERFPGSKQYFSDYVFLSPEVKVKKFSVPNLEVSDHLPMILEI